MAGAILLRINIPGIEGIMIKNMAAGKQISNPPLHVPKGVKRVSHIRPIKTQ